MSELDRRPRSQARRARKRWLNLMILSVIVTTGHVGARVNAVPMTVGAAEDTLVRWGSQANTVQNGSDAFVGPKLTGNPDFVRKSYIKFDLTGLDADPASAALLDLFAGQEAPAVSYVIVVSALLSGYTPGPGQLGTNWTETNLTWNNAPGNFNDATLLDPGTTVTLIPFPFSSTTPQPLPPVLLPVLGDYLQADNTVTLMLSTQFQSNPNPLAPIASSENGGFPGPMLTFEQMAPLAPATFRWNNPSGGDFDMPANWDNLTNARPGPPTLPDSALFDTIGTPGAAYIVNAPSDVTNKSLTFQANNAVTLDLQGNHYLLTDTDSNRSMTIDAPGSLTVQNGTLEAASGIWQDQGTLNINSGGIVRTGLFLRAGLSGGAAYVNVTGTGQLLADNSIIIGDQPFGSGAYGELNVETAGYAQTTNGGVAVGLFEGNTGRINVHDAGSRLVAQGVDGLRVGVSGMGELFVESSGRVDANGLHLGASTNGFGRVVVDNAVLDAGGVINIGLAAYSGNSGELTARNGAIVMTSGSLNVNKGTVLVDGASTQVTATLGAGIGPGSSVTVQNSAELSAGFLAVDSLASFSATDASVLLTSAGASSVFDGLATFDHSVLTGYFTGHVGNGGMTPNAHVQLLNGSDAGFAGTFQVGVFSYGKLTISGGSSLMSHPNYSPSVSSGVVGGDAAAEGLALVTGSNSRWIHTGDLAVGFFGNGTLQVEDQGTVFSPIPIRSMFVAREPGSTGLVTITGLGSTVAFGSLGIGGTLDAQGGMGDIFVEQQGSLSASQRIVLWAGGNLHILTGGWGNVGDTGVVVPADTLRIGPNGSLEGDGGVWATVWNDGGVVIPGHSPGELSMQSYLQDAGVMEFEIHGPTAVSDYDVVTVVGDAMLNGGGLLIEFVGYVPNPGDTFELLRVGGVFTNNLSPDAIEFVGLPPEIESLARFTLDAGLVLTFIDQGAGVPEPSTAVMGFLALAALMTGRRRVVGTLAKRIACARR